MDLTPSASFLVFLLVAPAVLGSKDFLFGDEKCFKNLKPQDPKIVFQGDGGVIEVWGKSFEAMKDASVAAARMTLKPGGMILPAYVDIPALKLVIQGNLTVGVINPMMTGPGNSQDNTYQLKQGDVVALPPGVTSWWLNTGNEEAVVICVGDTRMSPQPASEKVFFLAGGKGKTSSGSVAKGFSTKFLSQAWETSESDVKKILNSQQDGGIITVPKAMQLTKNAPSGGTGGNTTQDQSQSQKKGFIYHYADAEPDITVEQGGEIRELNSLKMPILKYVGLGAECVRLNKNAMVAPNWFLNGHQVVYVHTGSGKLQVTNDAGDRALDMELKPGSIAVIPKGFPSTAIAGPDGMKFVSVVTTNTPVVSFIAGSNSVYSAMPTEVVAAAFKIDPDMAKRVQQSGSKTAVIVPPKQRRS